MPVCLNCCLTTCLQADSTVAPPTASLHFHVRFGMERRARPPPIRLHLLPASADRLPPPSSHLHVATAVPLASHPSTPAVAAPPLLYSSQFPSLPPFIHTKIWGAPLQGKPASALKDWAALFPSAQHDSEHRNHSMSALSTRHTNCSLRTKHTNYGPNDAAAVPAFTPGAGASQNGGEIAATSGFPDRLQAM